MGCKGSKPSVEQMISAQLELQIEQERLNDENKIKLLLLGAGECGKSTFFKQIDLLHGKPRTRQETLAFRPIVFQNILKNMKLLINKGVLERNLPVSSDIKARMNQVLEIQDGSEITPEIANLCRQLWSESVFQKAYSYGSEYHLDDSSKYYFDQIETIGQAEWVPNEQDILRSRVRTTGIHEKDYLIDKKDFNIIDVGGQRNERRKWIHCFEGVTAIVFMAALSAYDSVLFEDETTNRMEEALALFDHIVNLRWFKGTSIILLLNKDDLFLEKIAQKDLRNEEKGWFMDYHGGCDEQLAFKYIERKFHEKNTDPDRTIESYRTTAIDTTNMRKVFNATKQIISDANMQSTGFF